MGGKFVIAGETAAGGARLGPAPLDEQSAVDRRAAAHRHRRDARARQGPRLPQAPDQEEVIYVRRRAGRAMGRPREAHPRPGRLRPSSRPTWCTPRSMSATTDAQDRRDPRALRRRERLRAGRCGGRGAVERAAAKLSCDWPQLVSINDRYHRTCDDGNQRTSGPAASDIRCRDESPDTDGETVHARPQPGGAASEGVPLSRKGGARQPRRERRAAGADGVRCGSVVREARLAIGDIPFMPEGGSSRKCRRMTTCFDE